MQFCSMTLKAVIFDMDGLLIDSEPHWREAGKETLAAYGKTLTNEQYNSSTGLRTEEWIDHWFRFFQIDLDNSKTAVFTILQKAIEKIALYAQPMPGINDIISFFKQKDLRIGLATSSPVELAHIVVQKLNLRNEIEVIASAGELPYGKPHPLVYIDCARQLGCSPVQCIAFEDSFNGMIAAKAARMKCVVVPAKEESGHIRWGAADIILNSLEEFNEDVFRKLISN